MHHRLALIRPLIAPRITRIKEKAATRAPPPVEAMWRRTATTGAPATAGRAVAVTEEPQAQGVLEELEVLAEAEDQEENQEVEAVQEEDHQEAIL